MTELSIDELLKVLRYQAGALGNMQARSLVTIWDNFGRWTLKELMQAEGIKARADVAKERAAKIIAERDGVAKAERDIAEAESKLVKLAMVRARMRLAAALKSPQ